MFQMEQPILHLWTIFLLEAKFANQFQYHLQSTVAILYETHVVIWCPNKNKRAMGRERKRKKTEELRRTQCYAYYMFVKIVYRVCAVCRLNSTHSIAQITKHLANLHDVKQKMTKKEKNCESKQTVEPEIAFVRTLCYRFVYLSGTFSLISLYYNIYIALRKKEEKNQKTENIGTTGHGEEHSTVYNVAVRWFGFQYQNIIVNQSNSIQCKSIHLLFRWWCATYKSIAKPLNDKQR